jgi:hypothetical protein
MIVLKMIYRSNTISIKIPMAFFAEIGKTTLKFIWKHKRVKSKRFQLCNVNGSGHQISHMETTVNTAVYLKCD